VVCHSQRVMVLHQRAHRIGQFSSTEYHNSPVAHTRASELLPKVLAGRLPNPAQQKEVPCGAVSVTSSFDVGPLLMIKMCTTNSLEGLTAVNGLPAPLITARTSSLIRPSHHRRCGNY
jgi:hypothetical protein